MTKRYEVTEEYLRKNGIHEVFNGTHGAREITQGKMLLGKTEVRNLFNVWFNSQFKTFDDVLDDFFAAEET